MKRKAIIAATLATLAVACGPEVAADDDDAVAPLGKLEYELPIAQFHRQDRRIDIISTSTIYEQSGCGFLTDRAYDDLTSTIDALDPSVDYGHADCFNDFSPDGLLHLEGFTHSPFRCNWYCCHPDLVWAATAYFAVASGFYDKDPNINGEIYVALEPDRPCP
jgi:hypothetical protein